MSEECYFREVLSNEITFLEDAEKRLEKDKCAILLWKENNNPFC